MNVGDVMTKEVRTVSPEMRLPELQRALLQEKVRGFPVVRDGRLVGVVSRSDIVRMLSIDQSVAEEAMSGFYLDGTVGDTPAQSLEMISEYVGRRIQEMTVDSAMIRTLVTVGPDTPLVEAAKLMAERRIHRLPVVADDLLVGILSATDFVRLTAEGALKPS
jgi:predicted transcriptional regulator